MSAFLQIPSGARKLGIPHICRATAETAETAIEDSDDRAVVDLDAGHRMARGS
jgi:hypothetical protein